MRWVPLVALLFVACSNGTGPSGVDPTVQIVNRTDWPVYFEWRDGRGVVGTDTVASLTRKCERFVARADSAYFYMEITNPNPGGAPATSTYTQPWFDPTARHAWAVMVTPSGGGPTILTSDTAVAC